jgi:hypothetical protein
MKIHKIVKPKGKLLNKLLEISELNHIQNIENKSKGFLLKKDYKKIFSTATRIYIDNPKEPTYVIAFFNNSDFKKHMGQIPKEVIENYIHAYAVMKDPRKKGNYLDFVKAYVDAEKKYSPGMWVLISEHPEKNNKSIELHTKLGWEKIGEHNEFISDINQNVKWGVYILDYNKLKI